MFLNRTAALALTLVMVGCASQKPVPAALRPSNDIPGNSIVKVAAGLRTDALKNLTVFTTNKFQCSTPTIKNTISGKVDGEVALDVAGRLRSGNITEQWDIDACGTPRQLKLLFGPDGKGGNYIAIGEIKK